MKINFTKLLWSLLFFSGTVSAQNVGIGTLTPTEKLHVEGSLRVTALGGAGNAIVMTNNTGVVSRTALSGSGTDVFTGLGTFVPISTFSDGWRLLGNSGTNPATNFVGTIDAVDFVTRTNNLERMRMTSAGFLGIGTAAPAGRLQVNNVDGSRMIYGTSGSISVYDAETFVGEVRLGAAWNRPGVYSSQQLELFSDATGIIFGDSDVERMRMTAAGDFGIGFAAPAERLHVNGRIRLSDGEINSGGDHLSFMYGVRADDTAYEWNGFYSGTTRQGIILYDGAWGGANNLTNEFAISAENGNHLSLNTQANQHIFLMPKGTGNVGVNTLNPVAKFQVVNGAIMPHVGNNNASGLYFPINPGGGGGDEAYIRYYVEAGENTKLVIANQNDADDDIDLQTGGVSRLNIDGDGSIRIDKGVFFDCNDCGDVNTIDGASNWGDLTIQGRVISTNSNLHLSPPGGSRVIINSTYRAAGGGTGTTGLDITDGGIRMRKNYMYFQRYRYCNCFGAGTAGYALGNWDFCAVAHVGFKNNQSNTDEDDDVQCAVYPSGAGYGEQTNYDYYYTEQYNTRRAWNMYIEALEDTNGITCAASCINFD